MSKNMQQNSDKIKHVRLQVPIEIYRRLKKYQAQKILDDKPEQNLAQVCIELLEKATKEMGEIG